MQPQPQPQGAGRSLIPSKPTLDHVKVALEVLLLLLAIPYVLRELARHPGRLSRRAATKHLAG